ncbi:MAG: hypothetical protein AW08_02314 [Candidatus Accumulibacter adjunctus]|uniref:Uncharacterized protein n=1 Tax=Candidatus Accumulibacter adjunctus TaxID=1454001 RepID=A0A011NRP1_9PROT|nr:MAG: hypothetical protein AW08_02314 [Candidatus Accumulibacter adjunctus]
MPQVDRVVTVCGEQVAWRSRPDWRRPEHRRIPDRTVVELDPFDRVAAAGEMVLQGERVAGAVDPDH